MARKPKTPPVAQALATDTGEALHLDALLHTDGWENLTTGLGNKLRDKRLASHQVAELLDYQTIEETYAGDDMAARIIDLLPDEALREGYEVQIAQDREAAEAVMARQDELGFEAAVHEAWCLARAFGGSGILMGADDGQKPSQPLNMDRIKSFEWCTVFDRQELQPVTWYSDPNKPKFGQVETYRTVPVSMHTISDTYGAIVHESRIIRFEGVKITRRRSLRFQGWGESLLVRTIGPLRDFHAAFDGASALVQDFAQTVMKIKGLANLMASNREDVVRKRFELIDMVRSMLRMVVVDADNEDLERKATPLTGLPELLEKATLRLAAAAQIPVTKMMGQAPTGLTAGAGAEGDEITWENRCKAEQSKLLRPRLNRLLQVLFRTKNGPTKGKEPENWSVQFRPMRQLSELQQAEKRNKQANTDKIYLDGGVVTPEEIALSRFGGDEYSTETEIDVDLREKLKAAPPEPVAPPPPPAGKPPPPPES